MAGVRCCLDSIKHADTQHALASILHQTPSVSKLTRHGSWCRGILYYHEIEGWMTLVLFGISTAVILVGVFVLASYGG